MKDHFVSSVLLDITEYFAVNDLSVIESALYRNLEDYELRPKKELPRALDTVPELVAKFSIYKQLNGCTKRTIDHYNYVLRKFFNFVMKPVQDVVADDILKFLYLRKVDRRSDSYIDNVRNCLSSFFKWCELNEIIDKNPLLKIPTKKGLRRAINPLTETEIEQIRLECY